MNICIRRRIAAVIAAMALAASACAGGSSASRASTFRIIASGDVDHIDPGQAYYNTTSLLHRVTSRTLVSYANAAGADGLRLVPDIATDVGQVSVDGLTYTFTIRDGVRYQPGAADGRQVRAEDFRYAIERGFKPSVSNGYVANYYSDVIVGDTEYADRKAPHIAGIDISDPTRVVFHLRRPTADFIYRLALTVASPVPEEYAAPFDAKDQSTYGPDFAATGPYMLERTGGKATGYQPGKRIVLVRNPNWDPKSDPLRHPQPERIEMVEGFDDSGLATDKILNGEFDYNGDFLIPSDKVQAITSGGQRGQLSFPTTNCLYYVTLRTTVKPFDDVRVRRAVNLVMDKTAWRLTGGVSSGDIATHVLSPGLPGFDEVGGRIYDPYPSKEAAGDVAMAQSLMREAGYSTGIYDGPPVLMIGATGGFQRGNDVVEASLAKIGIKVRREAYDQNIVFTKYLSVPDSGLVVGANDGWCADYPDPVAVIKPLFDGRLIRPSSSSNHALIDDPELNALIDKAVAATGADRARRWADADRKAMELAPIVPLTWNAQSQLLSARVRGVVFSQAFGSLDLATVSLTR